MARYLFIDLGTAPIMRDRVQNNPPLDPGRPGTTSYREALALLSERRETVEGPLRRGVRQASRRRA